MATPTNQVKGTEIILDTLIDGLRVSDLILNEKCVLALQAIGPRVIPTLSAAANKAASSAHRRRILDATELIEDMGQLEEPVGRHVWKALLDALRVNNKRLNDKAIEAFSCLPVEAVFELISEATFERRRKGYSERLTLAAMRLGHRDRPLPR